MQIEDSVPAWRQHLRLAILRWLTDPVECPDGAAGESLLTDLMPMVHVSADREQVRAEMVWLHGEGLVVTEVRKGALGSSITDAGKLVAEGKKRWPGVKMPSRAAEALSPEELLQQALKPLRPGG